MTSPMTLVNDITAIEVINNNNGSLTKREQNALLAQELYLDIVAFMSILYKMGFDDLADCTVKLVAMLNESGFRTVQGHEFTVQSYTNFMNRMNIDTQTHTKDILSGNI